MDLINLELVLKMCVALGAVLLTFGGVIFLFKKFGAKLGFSAKTTKAAIRKADINIESFQNIGPGRAIYVVQVDSKRVLIGATQQSINFLSDLEDEAEDLESFSSSLKSQENESSSEGFKALLSKNFMSRPRV